jgi:hypothetical protein
MNLKENDKGIIKFNDGSSAKVYLLKIEPSRSGMFPSDYWFEYEENETNRQIVHPDFGKREIIKSSILLPEFLAKQVFIKDFEVNNDFGDDEYENKLHNYLKANVLEKDYNKAKILFRRLENLLSKEEIITQYFNQHEKN